MNRDQVIELFKLIKSVYPTFEVDSHKVDTWTRLMKDMDFKRVMAKTEEHVQSNKFPPTIAEISAFAPPKNETLEKIEQWEREAAKVPQEVKERFRKKMEQLFEDKRHD